MCRSAESRPLTVTQRRLELYRFRNLCIAQAISMVSAVRHVHDAIAETGSRPGKYIDWVSSEKS